MCNETVIKDPTTPQSITTLTYER